MSADSEVSFRAARPDDAETVFNITKASIAGLSRGCYSQAQIENWMGERTPRFYEDLITRGRMTVGLRNGIVVGFVDAEPGEVTRLFVLPEAAGSGLGQRLLDIGVAQARLGHDGPIRLEATINAEAFYRRYGFRSTGRGQFSHGLGGEPIEIVHMEL
ncbi:GNAT family N-acetyltransferase [Bradyrhizobium sp. CCBAU 25338]|jgi:ribosomal protein S18 acetylase RimI-like enzyme|uniref:GNAT family N-acetyltransferase n=1 Tax=Bradyrhizobium sp. CCBAU 25338 TaxID=1641877 RepID=UPI0023030152|nr:GNAT family N-acetyltransferase [Bradyrhizobium sp. CCBAU 25338]MDA9529269.1 acetyltransferase [Bradyrhizobium sp. CCBAU 25338]